MKNNNKGFSLVELIVVIAIMAILAAIAIPTFAHFITKANEASDAELLNNINYIFNAACVENGVDIKDVTAATWNKTDKKVENVSGNGISDETAEKIEASFVLHYGEMKNENFILIENIVFDPAKHEFVESSNTNMTFTYAGATIVLSQEDIDALKNSNFLKAEGMSPEVLLGMVGDVVDFAGSFGGGVYDDLFNDTEYLKFMCETMGVDPSQHASLNDAFDAAMENAYKAKFAELMGVSANEITDEMYDQNPEKLEQAMNMVNANSAVLYSAHNATQKPEDIMSMLKKENEEDDDPKTAIKNALVDNYGNGMSQASAAYGLYVAYAYSSGDSEKIEKAESGNYIDVMNDLDDPGFQEYLTTEQAELDLQAYLSSMNIVNENASGNSDAMTNLLVNGFDDDELISIFESAVGN